MSATRLILFQIALSSLLLSGSLNAQDNAYGVWHRHVPMKITSFSVDRPDIPLQYPDYFVDQDLPDEHTSLLPFGWEGGKPRYLLFSTSTVETGGTAGAIALTSNDLVDFKAAPELGYARQVMASPLPFTVCDGLHDREFDENYAGPGSVIQDPTRPPGNLIMLYEAENHCPGGTNQPSFYATVGFARSNDNGRTWPAPVNSEFGNELRHPVLKSAIPQPTATYSPGIGDAIPAAFADVDEGGNAYLYVVYTSHDGTSGPAGISMNIARAALGDSFHGFILPQGFGDSSYREDRPLDFRKWYRHSFSEPGIGGLDSAILSTTSCSGLARMPDLTFNDDLGLYILTFVCTPSGQATSNSTAGWYYSTATSLDLQDWTPPAPIENSQSAYTDCTDKSGLGSVFDGFYPSLMSPGAQQGHIRLTGLAFFLNGCDHSPKRALASRSFTITAEPR